MKTFFLIEFSQLNRYEKLHKAVFFNATIRMFLESFIEMTLTSTINIMNVRRA
jgi:hypothetical protein